VDSTEVEDWGQQTRSGWSQQHAASTRAAGSSSNASAAAAAGRAGSAGAFSRPADHSYRKKHDVKASDQQQQQQERRPYMNIVNGRWVPPSREESEAMMRGSYDMGPDEGL
jgi:hypothetical protein